MIAPTVEHPQGSPETTIHPGYLGYLMKAAIDFGNELGVDPGQLSTMVEVLTSPVDGLE